MPMTFLHVRNDPSAIGEMPVYNGMDGLCPLRIAADRDPSAMTHMSPPIQLYSVSAPHLLWTLLRLPSSLDPKTLHNRFSKLPRERKNCLPGRRYRVGLFFLRFLSGDVIDDNNILFDFGAGPRI